MRPSSATERYGALVVTNGSFTSAPRSFELSKARPPCAPRLRLQHGAIAPHRARPVPVVAGLYDQMLGPQRCAFLHADQDVLFAVLRSALHQRHVGGIGAARIQLQPQLGIRTIVGVWPQADLLRPPGRRIGLEKTCSGTRGPIRRRSSGPASARSRRADRRAPERCSHSTCSSRGTASVAGHGTRRCAARANYVEPRLAEPPLAHSAATAKKENESLVHGRGRSPLLYLSLRSHRPSTAVESSLPVFRRLPRPPRESP